MNAMTRFLRRHSLSVGLAAVLAPLGLIIGLQYNWLAKLERMSAIAHKAALNNYVESVGKEVDYFYRSTAQRGLAFPGALFTQGQLQKAAYYWARKPVEGARKLFLVDYTRDPFGNILVFDPEREALFTPPASDDVVAIISACTPFQLLVWSKRPTDDLGLRVDERDRERRIILNPVTDDNSHVVGIVGMVVDDAYFREELLPTIMEELLDFFPDSDELNLQFSAFDREGALVLGPGLHKDEGETVSGKIPFIFTDWELTLHSHGSTPEQWAQLNFSFNMTLSIFLAAVLLGTVILALRAADRAMKLSQMKSDFVSNVSHELRTPLASIRVFAEFLRLGRMRSMDKVKEYGEYIETESRRLTRLINNILDFSRIESGAKTYDFVRADLEQLVEATLKTFQVRMRDSGFEVEFQPPESPLPLVEIDPDAVAQALNNLLDNAVKYSGDSRWIQVSLARDGEMAELSVRDRGVGIAKSEQRKIFERFHRVGTGLVHNTKGSGLGLSIVHHITSAHQGEVIVESEPGRGTRIALRLPLAEAELEDLPLDAESPAA